MNFDSSREIKLFSGTSHPCLADNISKNLSVEVGQSEIEVFPDGEIGIQILENVRGRDVFVVQSAARDPNHYLMELLIFVDALKRASCHSITAVLPYFPYSRQDRKDRGRVPITARLVANLLESSGVNRVLTMDLHADQIQGFFDVPVDNLLSRAAFAETINPSDDLVVVAPDLGSTALAKAYAYQLGTSMAIIDKRRIAPDHLSIEGIMGDVKGKRVLIVDDICSTGETIKQAVALVNHLGATQVEVSVAHFLADPNLFATCSIDKFYISDSIPMRSQTVPPFFEVVSIAPLFAEAIGSMVEAGSLSSLF